MYSFLTADSRNDTKRMTNETEFAQVIGCHKCNSEKESSFCCEGTPSTRSDVFPYLGRQNRSRIRLLLFCESSGAVFEVHAADQGDCREIGGPHENR